MKNLLIFIPARGGSQGIPNKNMAFLGGRPLISYTLDLCTQLKEDTLVSTDDEQIASYCSSQGFPTEYRRPKKLASNFSPAIDAALHCIKWFEEQTKKQVEHVMMLQPSTPLRDLVEIQEALNKYEQTSHESLVSMITMQEHPFECLEVYDNTTKKWSYLKKPSEANLLQQANLLRQEYPQQFGYIDGSFYIASKHFLEKENSFVVENMTYPFFLKKRFSIDIDEPEDLKMAEYYINMKN